MMPNMFVTFAHNFSHLIPGRDTFADYRYSVLEGKDLLEYNVEQQTSIITEAHFSKNGKQPPIFNTDTNVKDSERQAGYDATLRNFRANPSYPRK